MGARTLEQALGANHIGLVCLNIQKDYIERESPLFVDNTVDILDAMQRLMIYARAHDWPITHVHSRSRAPLIARGGPIASFEPRPSEPVLFKDRYSAFCCEGFGATLRTLDADAYLVIGFALALDCLATAHAAHERGVRLIFVEDAIGTPDMDGLPSNSIAAVLRAVMAPVTEFVRLRSGLDAAPRLIGMTP